jgi:DNA-directed RNA polymerase sigma subunit (sigma70/sigma32)
MPETCALDVADTGESQLEQIGKLFGVTRERIRQVQDIALAKLLKRLERLDRDL